MRNCEISGLLQVPGSFLSIEEMALTCRFFRRDGGIRTRDPLTPRMGG